jgi:predicted metalloprotease with PDZ domain
MSETSAVRYRVFPQTPNAHLFRVELEIDVPSPQGLDLAMPAWLPGSYMIREFAKNVVGLNAFSDEKPIRAIKADKQTWQIRSGEAPLRVAYEVYCNELSVRSAYLDSSRGFFNGANILLQPLGLKPRRFELEILRPYGSQYRSWRVATTLSPLDTDDDGFGWYAADTYEALIDSPVEMGAFVDVRFSAAKVPHRMIVSGCRNMDSQRLARDLEKICGQHALLFQDPLPLDHYLFIATALGEGYGGLEHGDSCALITRRDDLPRIGMDAPTEGYRRFLGLCSHEYFHLWNVKRIRPECFTEPDLSREVYTSLLWAFEGFTSYYDDLALVRSGCISDSSYIELLAQNITRVMRGSGRLKQSVAESSFDAWTKFYKQDENAPNSVVSYYTKGALVALGLDVTLRTLGGDVLSLDDLLRLLWQRHGKTGLGVPENGIQTLAEELLGTPLDDFFDSVVYGTEDPPLAQWLESLGVGMRLRPARDPEDLGGFAASRDTAPAKPVIGARFKQAGDFVEITQVFEGGAAVEAGLSAGDRLIAIDGLQVNAASLAERLAQVTPGRVLPVHAFRRDELYLTNLRPRPAPSDTCDLWWIESDRLTKAQLERRDSWLGRGRDV